MNPDCHGSDGSGRWCSGMAAAHVNIACKYCIYKRKRAEITWGGGTHSLLWIWLVCRLLSHDPSPWHKWDQDWMTVMTFWLQTKVLTQLVKQKSYPSHEAGGNTSSNTAFYRERNSNLLVPPIPLHPFVSIKPSHFNSRGNEKTSSQPVARWKRKKNKEKEKSGGGFALTVDHTSNMLIVNPG